MGFGSYDESAQQNQDVSTDDESDGVSVHEHEYEGEVTFETDADTDELMDTLADIKANADEA